MRAEVNDGLTMQGLLRQVFTVSSYGAELLCVMAELLCVMAVGIWICDWSVYLVGGMTRALNQFIKAILLC